MKYLYKDKIWYHASSDNECRWWLHWGKTIWSYEGYLFKNAGHNSIGLHLGGEENDIMIHAGVKGLFNFYFGVEDLFPRKMMDKLFGYTTRLYGISLFEEYISIEFHRDDFGMSEGWRGFHKMIDWKTILFGKMNYQKRKTYEGRAVVKMPEGDYHSTVEIEECTWKRKRFVKPIQKTRYTITPDIPIPEPGKGENGWDMDDDALVSGTYEAESLEDALNKAKESVLKTRRKRAGENWIPDKGFRVQLNT